MLRTCGEQYRLKKIERVTERPSSAAIAGRTVHEATELIDYEIASGETDPQALLYNGTRLAMEVLDKEVESALCPAFPTPESFRSFGQSKNNPAGQDIQWFKNTGIAGSLSNYIHWRLDDVPHYELMVLPSGELAIEVPFTINLGEVEIVGQIDRVFIDTKHDYKVIVDIKNGPKPDSNEQLALYREALLQLYPESGPYFGSFLYGLKPGSKSGVRQTYPNVLYSWDAERLSRIYVSADRQIENEIFLPNPGKSCFMCDVSDSCPFYAASLV